jgi:phosphatidate cytidylyltransferase
MRTRIIAALLMLPILPLVLFSGELFDADWVMTAGVSLVSAICVWELLWAAGNAPKKRLVAYAMVFAALFPVIAYLDSLHSEFMAFHGGLAAPAVGMLLLFILFIEAVADSQRVKFSHVAMIITAAVLIPLCFTALVELEYYGGWKFAILPFIPAFIGDISAYFAGRLLGKRKLTRVSPKKTVEGAIGGLAGVLIGIAVYGVVLQFVFGELVVYPALLLYGLLGGAAAQLGDLAMSLVKRESGIKDFGNLIPGHGGLLDRFDSLMFAAPVVYILALFFPAIWW